MSAYHFIFVTILFRRPIIPPISSFVPDSVLIHAISCFHHETYSTPPPSETILYISKTATGIIKPPRIVRYLKNTSFLFFPCTISYTKNTKYVGAQIIKTVFVKYPNPNNIPANKYFLYNPLSLALRNIKNVNNITVPIAISPYP